MIQITCPKCNRTYKRVTEWAGQSIRIQCQGCEYYAERKEFKIEGVKDFRNFESSNWVTGYKT